MFRPTSGLASIPVYLLNEDGSDAPTVSTNCSWQACQSREPRNGSPSRAVAELRQRRKDEKAHQETVDRYAGHGYTILDQRPSKGDTSCMSCSPV